MFNGRYSCSEWNNEVSTTTVHQVMNEKPKNDTKGESNKNVDRAADKIFLLAKSSGENQKERLFIFLVELNAFLSAGSRFR